MVDHGQRPIVGRPNLVVILLDCARASSFPETGGPVGSFPSLERLKAECTIFTRASTVAPWTLPSHASLFTGRYPWEHGVMGEGGLQLDETIPTVAGMLRQEGYGTLALSANGLVGTLFSSPGSFEESRCAEWWEKSLRWISPEALSGEPENRPFSVLTLLSVLSQGLYHRRARLRPESLLRREGVTPSLQEAVRHELSRVVFAGPQADRAIGNLVDALNRLAHILRSPGDSGSPPVASWIEPALEGWLRHQPTERPVHCFVNLLDLHEKYLSDGTVLPGLRSWLRFARISQNARLFSGGKERPTQEQLDLLRRLYEAILTGLDRRVDSIIRVFQRAGRWDNTLLIVTSDHGQAFGEHGNVFHAQSPFQTVLHVPLWIRWPHGNGGGIKHSDPVSLVDVAPTLLRAAGLDKSPSLPGIPLQEGLPLKRQAPVLAMADEYPFIEVNRIGNREQVRARAPRLHTIAYSGGIKVIFEARSGRVSTFDLDKDPEEASDLGTVPGEDGARAELFARKVAGQISLASDGQGPSDDLQERLRSWGYV
ncbi:MAG: sulfatase-like hydrolase/transferase [Thermoplasmata archaeon]|nr:sulfatase-like hydrolase/transferase [Thermoplasmata archaeon]